MDRLHRARGTAFTLVELLVVIAIIGTLMGLLLPAVQNAREAARSNSCRSNLTNLQKAMASYETANKEFPGYVNPVGNFATKIKASWSAMLLPYLERMDLWEQFSKGKPAAAAIEVLVCPSNPPSAEGVPAMAYVGNAGYIDQERPNERDDCKPKENIANGVFTDRFRADPEDDADPKDIRDLVDDCRDYGPDPVSKVNFAHLQAQGDGSTNTLMLAECLSALHWTYIGGPVVDKKWHFGFCWDLPDAIDEAQTNPVSSPDERFDRSFRVINGVRENLGGNHVGEKSENSAFPSSNHPGGVNVAFAGGQVQLLGERIHPTVYAQLMTSNRKQSDLKFKGARDRDIPMPDADAF